MTAERRIAIVRAVLSSELGRSVGELNLCAGGPAIAATPTNVGATLKKRGGLPD